MTSLNQSIEDEKKKVINKELTELRIVILDSLGVSNVHHLHVHFRKSSELKS
jgi:hypothetical protein